MYKKINFVCRLMEIFTENVEIKEIKRFLAEWPHLAHVHAIT